MRNLPFWQPKIIQGDGATTSDVIGSECAEEKRVQSKEFESHLLVEPLSLYA